MIIEKLEPGQIVYCNLKIKAKGKIISQKNISLSAPWKGFSNLLKYENVDDRRILKKFGVDCDATIYEIDLIHYSGFKSNTKEFTEVKASDEKRNKITGAYE